MKSTLLAERTKTRNAGARSVKAAVFDLGGVIINDLDVVYKSYCRVVRKFNKEPMSLEQFNRTFSPDWVKMYKEDGIFEDPEVILDCYLEASTSPEFHADSKLYKGALSCLTALKKSKKVCINTGYRTPELDAAFAALQLDKSLFDSIMTEDRAGVRKPDPVTLRKVAEELGLSTEDLVFVGDTVTDIECGKNAGCPTIAVTWGTNSKEDLKSAEPDYLVDSWEELHALLERM